MSVSLSLSLFNSFSPYSTSKPLYFLHSLFILLCIHPSLSLCIFCLFGPLCLPPLSLPSTLSLTLSPSFSPSSSPISPRGHKDSLPSYHLHYCLHTAFRLHSFLRERFNAITDTRPGKHIHFQFHNLTCKILLHNIRE